MNHNQITITAYIMLDNYYNNNNAWLSTEDALNGYELEFNGKNTIICSDISRRISDIPANGFRFEKYKRFNDTNYTAYRLSSAMNANDLEALANYCGYVKKSKWERLFDTIADFV